MNKNFFFFILTILIFSTHLNLRAQKTDLPISDETNLITYTQAIEIAGVVKNEFYHKAFVWCSQFYKNPADVIKKKDVLNGEIVCKGKFRINTPATKRQIETAAGIVQYTLAIMVEDNNYSYIITDINWKQTSHYPIERWLDTEKDSYLPVYAEYLKQVDGEIKILIKSLTEAMAMPSDILIED